VTYHYKERITDYKKQSRISTADSYNCSEKALKKFVEEGNKNYSNLTLLDINKNWLLDFEHFM
jgi:hypothetical protein